MIARALYRNPRLLLLFVMVVAVWGLTSWVVLPRMEDPVLAKRVAVVSAIHPGAGSERVESQVTGLLEQHLRDVADVKELRSISRPGVSTIVVELRDEVTDVDVVWSHVRDRLADASEELPGDVVGPEFQRIELQAFATLVAIKWNRAEPPNVSVLRRLAEDTRLSLQRIEGTQEVAVFGSPQEEIAIDVPEEVLTATGLSTGAIAQQIRESQATQPAGALRRGNSELLLEVAPQHESIRQLGETRIQYGSEGHMTRLADLATIRKSIVEPQTSLALVDGTRSIVVAALVRGDVRIDRWSDRLRADLAQLRAGLPPGIEIEAIFMQSSYVENRLRQLLWSLLLGTAAVVIVVFALLGWRNTIVVGATLPLSALIVLGAARGLEVPLHQMSVTGLIIALGLLIDNAIVIVDEVRSRIWGGLSKEQAIAEGVRHLAMPLFGSTLTTTLAFAPIALLPGPPGEFVGSIAISVMLAVNASLLLAMTVVPALTALLQGSTERRTWLRYGLSSGILFRLYGWSLAFVFRRPWLGVVLGAALPIAGFWRARELPEQFFPPTDRDQIQIEIELAAGASLAETQAAARSLRPAVLQDEQVARMHWFLGESAPTFFYNVVPRRRGAAFYGQAIVELHDGANPRDVVARLQQTLDERFAECRVLVRQLEQGPPFDAPIEIRLLGPDLAVLQRLGSQLRLLLSETSNVIHTRSDLEETLPKLALQADSHETRLAGLSQSGMARQLYSSLEGAAGGSLFEGLEKLPIRVRLANRSEMSLDRLGSLKLQPAPRRGPPPPGRPGRAPQPDHGGPALAALAGLELTSEVAAIPRLDGERMNEVKAYITTGVLPAEVLAEFKRRLAAANFRLPAGYSMQYGGESAKRDEAVRNLLANAAVLFALMLATMVLAFRSFRMALIIATVGGLSIGLGLGALWCFGFPFGFMAIVGSMGLAGVAINDAIVVLAGIRQDEEARRGEQAALREVVSARTRHVIATTLTTMAGFSPLLFGGGRFWPPLVITIAGGVGGATLLALFLVPSLYLLLKCHCAPQRSRLLSENEPGAS